MKSSKGFTLIELIIAIFILSVAVIGVYNAFSLMVVLTSDIADRLVASYLVQEGMEIVRNIRDNNWMSASENPEYSWLNNLTFCENGCQADYTTGTISPNATIISAWQGEETGGAYLNIDSGGFYSCHAGQATKFRRKISISIINDYTAKVNVKVYFDEKPSLLNLSGKPGSIEAEEILYNWY